MSSADDPLMQDAYGGASDEERNDQGLAGLRSRIANQAEDAIGRLADDLLENPMINSALSGAFAAREKLGQAQQSAMEALNLPSASDLDKLARRMRSISQRIEELEDGVDRIGTKLEAMSEASRAPATRLGEQLDRLESRIDQLSRDVAAIRTDSGARGGLAGEPPAVVG